MEVLESLVAAYMKALWLQPFGCFKAFWLLESLLAAGKPFGCIKTFLAASKPFGCLKAFWLHGFYMLSIAQDVFEKHLRIQENLYDFHLDNHLANHFGF